MAIKLNSAEGGTNTTAATTGNTGGASGDAFSAVNNNSGTSITFSTTSAFQGAMCYSITSGGNQAYLTAGATASDRMFFSGHVRMPQIPASTTDIIQFRAGGVLAAKLQLLSSGRWQLQNAASGTLGTSPVSPAAAINTDYRIEVMVIKGTTTSNGTIRCRIYPGNSTTELFTELGATGTTNAGSANIDEIRFGRLTTSAGQTFDTRWDAIQWLSDTDVPAGFGHPWQIQPITGVVITKLTSSSVSVAWNHPTDAPSGVSIYRIDGTYVNDALDQPPADPDYDPRNLTGEVVVASGLTSSPFTDSGLTPGIKTWWIVRDT